MATPLSETLTLTTPQTLTNNMACTCIVTPNAVFAESEARIQSQLGDISALSHCISFRPALDELCALGEAGIAHTLYAWTATRLTRELARVEAAALVLPAGPERRTAMLAALSQLEWDTTE